MTYVALASTPFAHSVPAGGVAALALFQAQGNAGDLHWIMIFVGIASCSMLFLALVVFFGLIAGAAAAAKSKKAVDDTINEMRSKLYPFIERTNGLIEELTPKVQSLIAKSDALVTELSPKIKEITANVEQISNVVKAKVEEFEPTVSAANQTVKDANAKTHAQVVRVNGMITSVLDATQEIGQTVHHAIRVPVVEVAGWVNGLKTGFETLVAKSKEFGSAAAQRPAVRTAGRPTPAAPVRQPGRYTVGFPNEGTAEKTSSPAEVAAAAAAAAFRRAEKQEIDL